MKRNIALILAMILILCAAFTAAEATSEDTATYSDDQYSFLYPSDWSQATASDGSIFLLNRTQDNAVMTFSVYTDVNPMEKEQDARKEAILDIISDYTGELQRGRGKNTVLDGTYEEIAYGPFSGFRAWGKWLSTGDRLVMDILFGESHMISFVMIGDEAIGLEEMLLNSVAVNGSPRKTEGEDGFTRWDGAQVSFLYPEHYSAVEQSTGILLSNTAITNTAIAVRIYSIDYEYDESLAAAMASASLPKSTNITADPEMVKVGDWNAAVIRGEISSGPVSYYIIGSGKTVLGIIFMGEDAIGYEEKVVGSMEIR